MIYFEKIEERDMDFVIMRAFTMPSFANLFFDCMGWHDAKILRIEHSLTDPEWGESDITVIAEKDNSRYALLIENKIDATAMPDQCLRYQKRGDIGVESGLYDKYAVFITAPQAYLDTNAEAQKYPNQVSYESMLDVFCSIGSEFDCEVVRNAIKKKETGYTVQEVPAITLFWQKLYAYSLSSKHAVEMYPAAGAKGSRSTWPQFRVPLSGTALYYKATPGVVDLQFSGKLSESARLKAEIKGFLAENMHWANTGGSVSLRIKVHPMDFRNPFEQYEEDVDEMLAAVNQLTALATKLNDEGYIV